MLNPPGARSSGGIPSHPLSAITAAWIFSCSAIFSWRSGSGVFMHIEDMTLLVQDQFGTRTAGRGDENEARDLVLARSRQHGNGAALAVADDGDMPGVDVRPAGEPFDGDAQVVSIVLQRDPLASAAALANAALVVSEDDESLRRQRSRELRENRDPGDELVALDLARAANQYHCRIPEPADTRRHRQRAGEVEPRRRDDDVRVGRIPDRLRCEWRPWRGRIESA